MKSVLAFDLGASSGRAILGTFDGERITLEEVHRFSNDPVMLHGTLYWDTLRLFHEIKQGLLAAHHRGGFASVGIDTWGVDFGLIDASDKLLENPIHYRDRRTEAAIEKLKDLISPTDLFKRTGIEPTFFNTIYQLYSLVTQRPELLARAETALLTPDLLAWFLTGVKGSEYCIASTTGLLNPWTRTWDNDLFKKLGLPENLFPPVVPPGTIAANLGDDVCHELGIEPVPVIRIASHDTASAVAAVPAAEKDLIYISSGTWSAMGIESSEPLISEESIRLMYTNEGGYDGKIRFLKNIMGLWLIQEASRQWMREGQNLSYADLARLALDKPALVSFIDTDDLRLSPPGDMPARIREICRETNQPVPEDAGSVSRCIYESLALKYRQTKENIERVANRTFQVLHIVGGGSQNGLLSQFAANATGLPVITGPVEATAIGNVAVQLITLGDIADLSEARKVVSQSFETKQYEPSHQAAWDAAYKRYQEIFK